MINCTTNFKNAFLAFGRQIKVKVTVGSTIYTDDDIISISPSFEAELFSASMRKMDIEMANVTSIASDYLTVSLGVIISSSWSWLDFGRYYIKEQTYDSGSNSLTLECYDPMLLAMVPYALEDTDITYPTTVGGLYSAICTKLGFTPETVTFTNSTNTVSEDLYEGLGCTYRDVLTEIAQAAGATLVMDPENAMTIHFVSPGVSAFSIAANDLRKIEVGEHWGPVNSVVLSRAPQEDNIYAKDDASILANGLTEVRIENNQIMDGDRSSYSGNLLTALDGLEFDTHEVEHYGLPWLDICDRITVTDLQGIDHSCVVMANECSIGKGATGSMHVDLPTAAKTDYTTAATSESALKKTVLRVNKQDQTITAEIERSTEADADLYSQLSLTSEQLTVTIGRIDNIHTGWRNLLRNSDTAYSNTSSPTAEYYLTDAPSEGEEVTLQIKGNIGEGADAFLVVNSGNTNPGIEIDLIELTSETYDDTTGIYKATFNWTLTNGTATADNTMIRIYSVPADSTRTASIEWIKLERGNQASDWTPAPEDQAEAIADAQETADGAADNAAEALTTTRKVEATMQFATAGLKISGTEGSRDRSYVNIGADKQTFVVDNVEVMELGADGLNTQGDITSAGTIKGGEFDTGHWKITENSSKIWSLSYHA